MTTVSEMLRDLEADDDFAEMCGASPRRATRLWLRDRERLKAALEVVEKVEFLRCCLPAYVGLLDDIAADVDDGLMPTIAHDLKPQALGIRAVADNAAGGLKAHIETLKAALSKLGETK